MDIMKRQLIELDSFQIKVRCLFKVADNVVALGEGGG